MISLSFPKAPFHMMDERWPMSSAFQQTANTPYASHFVHVSFLCWCRNSIDFVFGKFHHPLNLSHITLCAHGFVAGEHGRPFLCLFRCSAKNGAYAPCSWMDSVWAFELPKLPSACVHGSQNQSIALLCRSMAAYCHYLLEALRINLHASSMLAFGGRPAS